MSLVVFASAKGAPGVTTAALAVGALWPRPVVVADLDPAGGDIAVRVPRTDGLGLDPERGVIALAAAARRGLRPEQIPEHVQTVVGGLDVLVGVRSAEQGEAVSALWPTLAPALDAMAGVDVIADCGRLGIDGAHDAILRSARYVVLFCRPTLTSVLALRERVGVLAARLRPYDVSGTPIGIVVVADPSDDRGVAGVRETFDRLQTPIPVIGRLAIDAKGASMFEGHAHPRPQRTMLVRSARALATTLANAVAPFTVPAPAAVPALVAQVEQVEPVEPAQPVASVASVEPVAEPAAVSAPMSSEQTTFENPEFAAAQMLRNPDTAPLR